MFETQNRFEILSDQKMAGNSKETTKDKRSGFMECSVDDKLLVLFDELQYMRTEQVSCARNILNFNQALN